MVKNCTFLQKSHLLDKVTFCSFNRIMLGGDAFLIKLAGSLFLCGPLNLG